MSEVKTLLVLLLGQLSVAGKIEPVGKQVSLPEDDVMRLLDRKPAVISLVEVTEVTPAKQPDTGSEPVGTEPSKDADTKSPALDVPEPPPTADITADKEENEPAAKTEAKARNKAAK